MLKYEDDDSGTRRDGRKGRQELVAKYNKVTYEVTHAPGVVGQHQHEA